MTAIPASKLQIETFPVGSYRRLVGMSSAKQMKSIMPPTMPRTMPGSDYGPRIGRGVVALGGGRAHRWLAG